MNESGVFQMIKPKKLGVCSFSLRTECDYFGGRESKIKFEKATIWILNIHKHII